MDNKIVNSAKVSADLYASTGITTISAETALQMLKEFKIKPESIQVSDKGIAVFKDQEGNSFRAELSKEQVSFFTNPVSLLTKNTAPEQISLLENVPSGSAKTFTNIFTDKQDKDYHSELNSNNKNKSTEKDNQNNQWKFNASFGFNRTHYFDTDMHLKSSRLDVTIKDFTFQERTSADFYNPKTWNGAGDMFRWIDEPTNSLTLSASKNKNVFSLTLFHPKFLKEWYNFQEKQVTGTVDGVQVDRVMPLNAYYDQPGQMHLSSFENTYRQMDLQAGYGRDITLLDTHKYGKFVYTPSIYAGFSAGYHFDSYVKPHAFNKNESLTDDDFEQTRQNLSIQGANVAIGNKLKYEYGRANIFVENKFTFSHLEHQFLDGTAKYNMKYNATTFGLGFQLNKNRP